MQNLMIHFDNHSSIKKLHSKTLTKSLIFCQFCYIYIEMKKFISSLSLLGFLSFSTHGTTYFLYVTGQDPKNGKFVSADCDLNEGKVQFEDKLCASTNTRNLWALRLNGNNSIQFFAGEAYNENQINNVIFQYNVNLKKISVGTYPNEKDAIALLSVVFKILLQIGNAAKNDNERLLITKNFNRFEDFFANSHAREWYKFSSRIEQLISKEKEDPICLKTAKGVSNIISVALVVVGVALVIADKEQAAKIINIINAVIVFLNFIAEKIFVPHFKIFTAHFTNEDFIEFTPVQRLIPYYILSSKPQFQEPRIKAIGNIIQNRNSNMDEIKKDVYASINY